MSHTHPVIAKLMIVSLLVSPVGPVPGVPIAAAQVTTQVPPVDGGWPRAYTTASGSRVVLYQPQIGLWPEQKHMTAGAAVSYQLKDAPKPVFGTIKIEVDTKVALDERLVQFGEFKITQAHFPNIANDQLAILVAELNAAIPREERVIGLDRVMAMVDTSAIVPRNVEGLKSDPPPIYYSDTPAVLVNIDGDPVWSPIQGSELKFVVNTNWDLFEYPPAKSYFLRVNDSWLVADSVRGPWHAAGKLPDAFSRLPADDNWKEARAALPGKPIAATARPTVYVSTVPAELIRVNGAPKYAPVAGTKLLWVSNTESDVFRQGATGTIFYLVAGRWFSAPSVKGPWQFATPTLPEDFKKIPLDHPRSRVLASVPGTRPAIEAILLAQIPQTARVNRKELKAPDVAYAGEPQFEPIPQTTVARAVNTNMDIIKVGDLYYMCAEGVWFKASSANGPWAVADSVPAAIYEIPISSPAHDVTYVTIEDSDDEWVEFAAAAAYTGMMVGWGCMMWGSGYYYPPYIYGGAYFGHYPSYGYGAAYNPWTGAYTRGGGVYGPYGGAGYASRYNPRTGTYSRGAVAYGPGGARGVASAWNPRTGTGAVTRQGSNVYGSWGSTAVQRGDQWATTSRVTNRATGTTTRGTQGSGGGAAVTRNQAGVGGRSGVARTGSGDVYAGRDGNVYRNQGGTWQKHDNGGWSSVDRPTGTSGRVGPDGFGRTSTDSAIRGDLNRDRAGRYEGQQRTNDLGRYRSSGGSRSSAGSYRGGGMSRGGGMRGGGMRGGGGRR
jgi:hypothetical protein